MVARPGVASGEWFWHSMGMRNSKKREFSVVVEKDEDGYYAFCPELRGCYTSGETFEEARANLVDAVRLHITDRLADGEEIRPVESVTLTSVEIAV